jgi:ABC-type multidrug transport system fused ATPase/permease subunit
LKGIQNIAGSFFALQVFWCLVGTTALDVWNAQRRIAHRQLTSGYYGLVSYCCSQSLTDLFMLRILPPVAFTLPFALLTGKCDTPNEFAIFSCILILTSTSFSSICLLIGAVVKTPRTANALGVLVMIFSLMFGGLLVNRAVAHLDHSWYESLYYMAPLSYSYEAMMVQVLRNADIDFNPKGFDTNVKTDGSVWLANFGLNADRFYSDLYALIGFTAGSLILTLPLLSASHGRLGTCNRSGDAQNKKHRGCENALSLPYEPPQRPRLSASNIARPLLSCVDVERERSSETDCEDVFVDRKQEEEEQEEHHVLTFTEVKFVLSGGRSILQNVRGTVNTKRGGVFAIMGPSGAGKTSLLDIVAGKKNTGTYEGHVMVDGVEYASLKMRKDVFGYVMQEETLVSS